MPESIIPIHDHYKLLWSVVVSVLALLIHMCTTKQSKIGAAWDKQVVTALTTMIQNGIPVTNNIIDQQIQHTRVTPYTNVGNSTIDRLHHPVSIFMRNYTLILIMFVKFREIYAFLQRTISPTMIFSIDETQVHTASTHQRTKSVNGLVDQIHGKLNKDGRVLALLCGISGIGCKLDIVVKDKGMTQRLVITSLSTYTIYTWYQVAVGTHHRSIMMILWIMFISTLYPSQMISHHYCWWIMLIIITIWLKIIIWSCIISRLYMSQLGIWTSESIHVQKAWWLYQIESISSIVHRNEYVRLVYQFLAEIKQYISTICIHQSVLWSVISNVSSIKILLKYM